VTRGVQAEGQKAASEDTPTPRVDLAAQLCRDYLRDKVKHLEIAGNFIDDLVQVKGFSGLADGLAFLHRLLEEWWDRVFPRLIPDEEEGDGRQTETREERGGRLRGMLNERERGLMLPNRVLFVPLFSGEDGTPYGYNSYERFGKPPAEVDMSEERKRAQYEKDVAAHEAFVKARQAADVDRLAAQRDALTEAEAALQRVGETLARQLPDHAPSLGELTGSIQRCKGYVESLIEELRPAPKFTEAVSEPTGNGHLTGNGHAHAGRPNGAAVTLPQETRDDAFRLMEEGANLLRRLEPHSPISYMVLRAIKLGRMELPELYRALLREANTLPELFRECDLPT
jgi:type VI secretion system protein ImpA